jgi:hypothetical protein
LAYNPDGSMVNRLQRVTTLPSDAGKRSGAAQRRKVAISYKLAGTRLNAIPAKCFSATLKTPSMLPDSTTYG